MHDDDAIQLRQPDRRRRCAPGSEPRSTRVRRGLHRGEFENDRATLELDRLIGAVDGETWVGAGGAYSLRLTVPGGGRSAPPGSRSSACSPTHRRRGILRQMMRWLLDQARERGEPVAILWASEGAIYQHFGYGIGTLQGTFDVERSRAPVRPAGRAARAGPPRRARRGDAADPADLRGAAVDDARLRSRGTTRTGATSLLADAEWMRHGNGPKFIAVLEVDGDARGYAIYRVKDELGRPRAEQHAARARGDRASTPPPSAPSGSGCSGSTSSATSRAGAAPVPHPLLLQLTEPRRLGMTDPRRDLAAHRRRAGRRSRRAVVRGVGVASRSR